jgi:hypothetical protein
MFGFKDIGLGMEGGSGSLAIGPFLLVRMLNGFLVIGDVNWGAGFGFLVIGDIGDVSRWQGANRSNGLRKKKLYLKKVVQMLTSAGLNQREDDCS